MIRRTGTGRTRVYISSTPHVKGLIGSYPPPPRIAAVQVTFEVWCEVEQGVHPHPQEFHATSVTQRIVSLTANRFLIILHSLSLMLSNFISCHVFSYIVATSICIIFVYIMFGLCKSFEQKTSSISVHDQRK